MEYNSNFDNNSNKWNCLWVNSILDCKCYIRHGFHLNGQGKNILCDLIAKCLINTKPTLESQYGKITPPYLGPKVYVDNSVIQSSTQNWSNSGGHLWADNTNYRATQFGGKTIRQRLRHSINKHKKQIKKLPQQR